MKEFKFEREDYKLNCKEIEKIEKIEYVSHCNFGKGGNRKTYEEIEYFSKMGKKILCLAFENACCNNMNGY